MDHPLAARPFQPTDVASTSRVMRSPRFRLAIAALLCGGAMTVWGVANAPPRKRMCRAISRPADPASFVALGGLIPIVVGLVMIADALERDAGTWGAPRVFLHRSYAHAAAAPFAVRMRRVESAFGSGLSGCVETTLTRVGRGLFPLAWMTSTPERVIEGRCRSKADHLVIHGAHHDRVVEIDAVDLLELPLGGVALRRWRSGLPVPIVTRHADRADAAAQLAWEMEALPRPEPTTYR